MRTCPCGYKWSSARALGQQYVRYTAHISSWYESDDTETEVLHVCCHKEAWISPFSLAVTKELSLHPTSSVPHLTVFSFPSLSLRSQSSYTTHSIPLLILCFMEILLLPFSFLLASHAPMKWPCCNSIDFSSVFVWNPISTALRGISSSPPQSWKELILFHEDTFHSILSICFPRSLPPPLLLSSRLSTQK